MKLSEIQVLKVATSEIQQLKIWKFPEIQVLIIKTFRNSFFFWLSEGFMKTYRNSFLFWPSEGFMKTCRNSFLFLLSEDFMKTNRNSFLFLLSEVFMKTFYSACPRQHYVLWPPFIAVETRSLEKGHWHESQETILNVRRV